MWFSPSELRDKIRREIKKLGSQKAFAEKYEVSPQYVNDVFRNRRAVSPQLAKKLGFEYRVMYWKSFKQNGR